MSTRQPWQSTTSAEPSISPLPEDSESVHIYGCKWGWCRSTFSNGAELTHHVIHEHARRAIPVRRRDIPLLRRAEDSTGESLKFSYVLNGHSSNSVTQQSQKSEKEPRNQPYSSLPSPPASSRANTSPLQNDRPLPVTAVPTNVFRNHDDLQTTEDSNARSFASLSSPAGSSTSFCAPDIPDSPSFSSLVNQSSNKRKLAFDAPENPVAKHSKLHRHHPLSQSANSSTGSHASVEQHLTQSLESSEDEFESNRQVDDDDAASQTSDHQGSIHASSSKDEAYPSELAWGVSQPTPHPSHVLTQANFTQESHFEGDNYDLLSQAPSQFQTQPVESFPFHYHGPKSSTSSQTEPESSFPLHLSPPVPLPSSKYANSTPQRQNWYQPSHSLQRSVSQTGDRQSPAQSHVSPKKPIPTINLSQTSHRDPPKSKKFRSGTLQISPSTPSQDRMAEESPSREQVSVHDDALLQDIYGDILSHPDSQPYLDSSQSLDDFSYPPLQTQAPYDSQSMSQI